MKIPRNLLASQLVAVAVLAAGLVLAPSLVFADADYSGVGDWDESANWTGASGATGIPAAADYVTITGGGVVLDMDADTWSHFVANSLLTGGATGEYRLQHIRLGQFSDATLNFDIGDGNIVRTTKGNLQYAGSQSGSSGTMNIYSGDIRLEASPLDIAEKAGSTGLINVSGSSITRLIAAKEAGGVSMQVGTGGNGTFQIDSGKFRSRAGVTVGSNGLFRVLGSSVTEVAIGDESTLDGNWTQNAGGVLEMGIDSSVTPIVIADKGGSGTFATFDAGSLLDVSFLGAPTPGTWNLMEVVNGAITDNGLALTPSVASGWSFAVDNSGANGLLTATYVIPEPASLVLLAVGGLLMLARRRK